MEFFFLQGRAVAQPNPEPVPTSPQDGAALLAALRRLVLYAWSLPPVCGFGFILLTGVLTPGQLAAILTTPLEPAYIIGWLAFALWALPRQARPLADWLDGRAAPDAAQAALRRFPVVYWAAFLAYLALAPVSVIAAAALYTDYAPRTVEVFRIALIALSVSIIVGLPIFFRMLDLFGRALGELELRQPVIGLRTRLLLTAMLTPLLVDTLLVQYYWTRTGFFTLETFWVWLGLALLAATGALLVARSLGQSLNPLATLLGQGGGPAAAGRLRPQSTDELGVLTGDMAALLDRLHTQNAVLDLNNQLLRAADSDLGSTALLARVADLCQQALATESAFVVLREPDSGDLVAVAQAGSGYRAAGYWRLSGQEPSLARACLAQGETLALTNLADDARTSQRLRLALGTRSALVTPIPGEGDDAQGVLIASTRSQPRDWRPHDVALIENLAREAGLALVARRLREARERAEAARREESELLRLIMDTTEQGIYGGDREGRCLFINRAALRLLGYDRADQVLGQPMHALIHHSHGDGSPCPAEACRMGLATSAGTSVHCDTEVFWRSDGTSFPVEYWARPIERDGRAIGTVVSFVDITARRRTEQAEARRQRMLQTLVAATDLLLKPRSGSELMQAICTLLVEQAGFGMAWIGMVGGDRRVVPVAFRGIDQGYLAAADVRADDSPRARGPVGTAIREGRTVITEDTETDPAFAPWREMARARGFRSVLATPVRVDGDVVGALAIYASEPRAFGIHEITLAQRLAADLGQALAREAADAALRASERRLEALLAERTRTIEEQATILDQIHDAVVRTDLDGIVTGWNQGAQRLFGYTAQEMLGQPVALLHPDPDFLRERIIEPLKARGAHEVEVSMQRKDGSLFDGHLSLSLLHDAGGRPVGMIGYTLDISRRRMAERLLAARSRELAAINRELEAFSYSVSHDLRAPLRAIDGFSQALLEDYGAVLDATGRDYLQRVRAAAQRMAALIDGLLTLSRLARAPLARRAVDLSALAREVIGELQAGEPRDGVAVHIEPGIMAEGDPTLLRIVLANLLGNAWKYTRHTPAPEIRFGTERDNDGLVYFVRDNGVGFEMQYADKLFGVFQRLHHASQFEGTGIGLATVQRVIHRHGGRVWAQAEPGHGAIFRFTLGPGLDREGAAP